MILNQTLHNSTTTIYKNTWFYFILFLVFNATFINISAISWRPVLVVEEAGVPGENHRPWTVADPGGAHRAPPPSPPKKNWKKIWFFCVKSWFFTRNTPNIFAPPSARRDFFKCAPLTLNPGSAPDGQATGKLYHLRLWVECTFFVIYKARREPTPYWW